MGTASVLRLVALVGLLTVPVCVGQFMGGGGPEEGLAQLMGMAAMLGANPNNIQFIHATATPSDPRDLAQQREQQGAQQEPQRQPPKSSAGLGAQPGVINLGDQRWQGTQQQGSRATSGLPTESPRSASTPPAGPGGAARDASVPPGCRGPDTSRLTYGLDGAPYVPTWGRNRSGNVRGARVAVLTPAYGGQIHAAYMLSMHRLYARALMEGFEVHPILVWNESLVTRARNYLVMYALDDPKIFTHLMFIDADIEFEAESVVRMLRRDQPIMCGVYAKKSLDIRRLVDLARRNPFASQDALLAQAVGYVVDFDMTRDIDVVDKWTEVKECGTGFMMIQRATLEVLQDAYPHLHNQSAEVVDRSLQDPSRTMQHLWHFFDTMIEPDTGRYLSEDYVFLKRWRDIGGRVFADLSTKLTHHGTFSFHSDPWVGVLDVQNGRLRQGFAG